MEIVSTAELTAHEWLLAAMEGETLSMFMPSYPTIGFLLTRSLETPGIFNQLIDNIGSIDSTTRHHIAFVGFQNHTTPAYLSPQSSHRPGAAVELRICGMKTTADMRHQTGLRLKELLQFSPTQLARRVFASEMTSATDALLDIWRFDEASLPGVAFVNAKHPRESVFCRIDATSGIQDLYSRILKPLSIVLRHYERLARAATA
jgi:hypothetical protein